MPLVSVLMSVFNEKEEWLKEAIDSILNQTFLNFEFIIINDNPERELNMSLLEVYKEKDSRIVVLNNSVNIGLTKSLNVGLRLAKGKYIARMDADDISLPKRLEMQFDFLERNSNCIVCGTFVENFGLKKGIRKYPVKHGDCLNELIINSCFAHPSVMFRRDVLLAQDIWYDENMRQSQDYKLWVDLINLGEFCNISEVLLKYRITNQQVSTKNKKSQQGFARECRRIAIGKLFENKALSVLLDKFNSKDIKSISSRFKGFKNLTPLLWLSLENYRFFDLLNFLASGSFLKCTLVQNGAVCKRFILGADPLI